MNLTFRVANIDDLPEIVRMLHDDFLGQQRERFEDPLPEKYIRAFNEIDSDDNNELIVGVLDGAVVSSLQLTFTPSISFQGGKRCTVESVRVDERHRGKGIGRKMMLWTLERGTHVGMKLKLT
jgi:ribosomal protein S18 acetylase RimI-like enzyme